MRNARLKLSNQPMSGAHDLHVPVTDADHRRGALRPKVTLVEYADFGSTARRAAEPAVRLLLAANSETLQLVYRHCPMQFADPHALVAAEAAEAAAAQGKFWEMQDALLKERASLSRAALNQAAEALGPDIALFKSSLDDEIYRQRVRESEEGGAKSHLHASPEFFVNGMECDVSFGMGHLEGAIRAALARA